MPKYLKNIFISISQLCNTLLGGDPDETMSSRIGKRARDGCKVGIFLSCFLNVFEKDHAELAIEEDEGKDATFK